MRQAGLAQLNEGSNLYVSVFFILTLAIIGVFLFRDAVKSVRSKSGGPSVKLLNAIEKIRVKPLVYFRVANVRVSLPLMIIVGFCTGFMAGTIGVGGFIGVPAMIYLFGCAPTVVATGTELFLAMFMGAFGALNYGLEGFVDVRIVVLVFTGSLPGLFVGTIGTKIVRESYIRFVTALLVLLCVFSRILAVPGYLQALHFANFSAVTIARLDWASAFILFGSGAAATFLVLIFVVRAHVRERCVFRYYRPAITDRRFAERIVERHAKA